MIGKSIYSGIGSIAAIEQLIVVDKRGRLIESSLENTDKQWVSMVAECGNLIFAIGKSNFTYAVFKRKSGNDFLIFPVGNHYLGMIKQKDIKTLMIVNSVKKFLADIISKGSRRHP